nr:cytochrome c [Bacteroidota bacterium]
MKLFYQNFTKAFLLGAFFAVASCSSNNKAEKQSSTSIEGAASTSNAEAVQQGSPETGVGPFKTVDLGNDINTSLAEQGKALFEGRCIACHKFDEKFVGPALKGVTERRNPVW